MSNRSISSLGLARIEAHEGFRAEAAKLAEGRFVVGFGHVCDALLPAPLTRAEAAMRLVSDLAPVEQAVNDLVKTPLMQAPFDALVSFAFSVGVEAFAHSDVLRRINAGEIAAAACAMDAWRKSDVSGEAQIYEVLVRRRAAEKAMLLGDHAGAPSAWLKPQVDHAAAILGSPAAFGALPRLEAAPVPEASSESAEPLPAPANDCEPMMLTRRIDWSAVPKVEAEARGLPRRGAPMMEQAAFAALALFGLALVLLSAFSFFRAAPLDADLTASLLLAAPGVAAAIVGLFFLTRRARAAFA